MKKVYALLASSALFLTILVATPSLSFGVEFCGLVCKAEVKPMYSECTTQFNLCNATSSIECQTLFNQCNEEVKEYQLSCLDRCLLGL